VKTGSRLPWPWRKLRNAGAGLLHAARTDRSMAVLLPVSLLVMVVSIALARWVDVLLVVVTTGLSLAAELFNSAIEDLCDFVEGRRDERIGRIKDIASAATTVSHLTWAAVLIYEAVRLAILLPTAR
jgi:diacylglycerol kinase (ATP)